MANETMEVIRCKGCGEGFDRQRARGPYCVTCSTVTVHGTYTRAELSEAFDSVKNQDNWKMPIDHQFDRRLTGEEIQRIDAAVVFYAGCHPRIIHMDGRTLVQAVGYYAAVGA